MSLAIKKSERSYYFSLGNQLIIKIIIITLKYQFFNKSESFFIKKKKTCHHYEIYGYMKY